MIIISKTFNCITPESAEDGDFSESGFVFEDEEFTFRETVDLMREHYQPSSWPTNGETGTWLSSGFETEDYSTGEEKETSIHFSRSNPDRNAKYWRLAMIAAGIIKN